MGRTHINTKVTLFYFQLVTSVTLSIEQNCNTFERNISPLLRVSR
jgi:hypothetical protein